MRATNQAGGMEKLIAVGLAIAVAGGLGAAWRVQAPSQHDLEAKAQEAPVLTRIQSAVASSPSFIADMVAARNAKGDDVRFLFGTSELEYVCDDTAHPTRFFDEHDYGFSLMCVGNAGCQSLWQAMELAALEEEGAVSGNRIALMLGTQWFMEDGLTESAFAKRFSEETFATVMANPRLSDATKQKIYDRCVAMGADPQQLDELKNPSLVSSINRAISDLPASVERSEAIMDDVNEQSRPFEEATADKSDAITDWEELDELVVEEGKRSCTNNDLGIYDEYYTDIFVPQDKENREKDEPQCTEWSEKEFGDFEIFLDVCRDLGIKPLVVLQPAKGAYYDNTPYDKESREIFYNKIRSMIDEADAELLDLTPYEYDMYYLRDVMHPEWKSWVIVNQKLCELYGDSND